MNPRLSGAHELAALLSVAARIEPELMRAVRITAAPRLGVAAETGLWFGDLVDRRGYGYVVLRPELLPELRAELAGVLATALPDAPVHRLWAAVEYVHRDRSPALLAEERAVWHAIKGGRDSRQGIERALRPALRALVTEDRIGVGRWFAGAWERLPEAVRATTVAWQLATVTDARLSGVSLRAQTPNVLTLTDVALIADRLPTADLRVRRDGPLLVFGEPETVTDCYTLAVPATDPRVLEVLDPAPGRTLQVPLGAVTVERLGERAVRLLAADGAVYEIPAVPAAAQAPGVTISHTGFSQAWAEWIAHLLERTGLSATLTRWEPAVAASADEVVAGLTTGTGRVLMVLDDWHFQYGPFTDQEWATAFRRALATHPGRLVAASACDAPVPDAVAAELSPVELLGLDEREAARRLLYLMGVEATAHVPPPADADSAPRSPYRRPHVTGGVPSRNERFSGREELIGRIRGRLTTEGATPGVVVLRGPSGIGKTQIAAEYAHRFASEYDVVWWVPADTVGTLRLRLAELAPAMGLLTGSGYGERLRAVRDSLFRGEPYPRWLLVLDSAEDVAAISELLPGGPGHVLLTSRNRRWESHGGTVLDVPVYAREESVAFVRRRARRLGTDDADRLADAVRDLPLLLDQTTGWLQDAGTSVEQYVGLLGGTSESEEDVFQARWSIVFGTLRERHPAAVELLQLLAMFAPDAIPLQLVCNAPEGVLPERLAALVADPSALHESIDKLVQYAVVQSEGHGPDVARSLRMHRLLHRAVRGSLAAEEREVLCHAAHGILTAADPGQPGIPHWSRYAELVPHLEPTSALETADVAAQQLVLGCLRYLYVSGEYWSGLRLAENATRSWRLLLGEAHPRFRELVHHRANLLWSSGEYGQAELLQRAVVEDIEARQDSDDPDLLRAMSGLGASLRGLGRYEDALQSSRTVLDGYRRLFGERDGKTFDAMNNLEATLRLLGRYGEALELNDWILDVRREVLGLRHPRTLYSEIMRAWDLRLLGRLADAVDLQERNVHAHREVLGVDQPQTLRAEQSMGMCWYRAGDRASGRQTLARVQERLERVLGEADPLTLLTTASHACVLRGLGDLERARELALSVARRYERLGAGHPFAVGTLANVALVEAAAGEDAQARDRLEAALTAMREAVGADHPWTLGIAVNTAAVRRMTGDEADADALGKDTLRRARATLGRGHPLTVMCGSPVAGWDFEPQDT